MTTQEQARANQERADRERGKSPGKIEMEDLGKTSRTPDEIKRDAEKGRDHGEPATTQQIPVTPAPISQEELEAQEDEKRQKNREVQYPAGRQMGMRKNRVMGSSAPKADVSAPPHTPGITPKAAMLAGSIAGSKTPPTKPTRTDGRLGGTGKPMPFKPQSIAPPMMAVHGKT